MKEYQQLADSRGIFEWVGAVRIRPTEIMVHGRHETATVAEVTPNLTGALQLPLDKGAVISHRTLESEFDDGPMRSDRASESIVLISQLWELHRSDLTVFIATSASIFGFCQGDRIWKQVPAGRMCGHSGVFGMASRWLTRRPLLMRVLPAFIH